MGINAAFSSWLSLVNCFVRHPAAQNFGAAFQAQAMTTLNTAQRAVTQPVPAAADPATVGHLEQHRPHHHPGHHRRGSGANHPGRGPGAQQTAQQIVEYMRRSCRASGRDASRAIRAARRLSRALPGQCRLPSRSPVLTPRSCRVSSETPPVPSVPPGGISSAPVSAAGCPADLRAHAPIVQGVQRRLPRHPCAPAAIQSASGQCSRLPSRSSSSCADRRVSSETPPRAIRAAPAAIQSAPVSAAGCPADLPCSRPDRAGCPARRLPRHPCRPGGHPELDSPAVQAHAQIVRELPGRKRRSQIGRGCWSARVDPGRRTSQPFRIRSLEPPYEGYSQSGCGLIAAAYDGFAARQDVLSA